MNQKQFDWWFSGLVDGRGSFYFHKKKGSFSVPQFQIKVRGDRIQILEMIQIWLQIGTIKTVVRKDREFDQAVFLVTTKDDCVELCKALSRVGLQSYRDGEFEFWKESVMEWAKYTKNGGEPSHLESKMDAGEKKLTKNRRKK